MDRSKPIAWIVERLNLAESLANEHVHILMSIVALAIIGAVSLIVRRRLKNTDSSLLPDEKPTLANFLEIIVSAILSLMDDVMGPGSRKHLPIIGSVFIYILVCNLISIVPGLIPPTENLNTNLGCAVVVFVYYHYAGIRERGFKRYVRHMAGPIIWIAPLMLAIELVSHIVRPISLSVRLFGNIMGDHMVLGIFSDLIPLFVPMIFMCMAIFIALIQAFVFALLSMIYISLATGEQPH